MLERMLIWSKQGMMGFKMTRSTRRSRCAMCRCAESTAEFRAQSWRSKGEALKVARAKPASSCVSPSEREKRICAPLSSSPRNCSSTYTLIRRSRRFMSSRTERRCKYGQLSKYAGQFVVAGRGQRLSRADAYVAVDTIIWCQ